MRLFQIINAIPDDQKILFNVKGCTPKYSRAYTWAEFKKGLRLHGWCCKVSEISTRGYLYLEIENKRVKK